MKKLIFLIFIPCLYYGQWSQLGADVNGILAGDRMGDEIAFDANGRTFVSGMQSNNNSTGLVQIFQWDGTNWSQKGADITGANTAEQFGLSVDISADGNTVVIGAPNIDPGYTAVYEWNGSNWIQKGSNIIGENNFLNGAGRSVSINANGNFVAIGADGNSNSNDSYTGQVRIYEWNGTSWIQMGTDIDGLAQSDAFGASVSLNSSGNLVAVGATGADIGGQASVFEWNGSNWIQMGPTLSGGQSNAFGTSVDLDTLGITLSVGATSNDADFGSGYIEVYSWDGTTWSQKGMRLETDPNGDDFFNKAKLSADGNIVVAGGFGTGLVHVYKFDGVIWNIINLIFTNGDAFGDSVDISDDGSRIVVGAPANSENGSGAGEVKVFENPCPEYRDVSGSVPTGVYRASDSVVSNGLISLMSSGGNVEYKAGNCILLNNGFQANETVIFEVIIENCP